MKKKIMAWILSGIMMLQPIAGVQAAEFSDGVTGYFNEEENETEENQVDDFSINEDSMQFSDEQNDNAASSEITSPISEFDGLKGGDEKIQELEVATSDNISGKCGDDVHWSFKDGTLTIGGNGDMYDYDYYHQPLWCKLSSNDIETIVIEKGITYIGAFTFYGCSLKTIILPEGVTSIGKYAFYGCSLKTITLPKGVTSIGESAFHYCKSLETVTLEEGITNIGQNAFFGCRSLKTIILPEGVRCIGYGAFRECESLKTITLPEGVASIGARAFYGCNSLEIIMLPEGITSIEGFAFSGCWKLKTITLPKGVISIENGVFEGCNSLETITLPEGVARIGDYAFYGCSSLKTITLPEEVTSIGDYAFSGCRSLETMTLSERVKYISSRYAFYGCSSLKDIYYSGSEAEWKKLGVTFDHDVAIHYNRVSTNKTFKLSVNQATILGNNNYIFADYEASTSGNVSAEEKQIKWSSSNPSIAEIKGNPVLIDSQNKNKGSGPIELSVYDVGEVTIIGTAVDGRTASVTINVEPKLQRKISTFNISEKTTVTICSVQLKNGNKQYLESFMKSLKVQDTGSYLAGTYVKIDKTEYKISDDGKTADLICTFTPIGDGNESSEITCTSPNGQKFKISVGKLSSSVKPLQMEAAFGDKTKEKTLHWTKDGYTEKEVEVNVKISNLTDWIHLNEISVNLKNLKMFKIKDASGVTNIGSDYTYKLNMDQSIAKGETITVKLTLVKKGVTWWKADDGNMHSGEIFVTVSGNDKKENIISGNTSLNINYKNDLKTQKSGEEVAEQEAEKNAEQSLVDAVDAFTDLSDKMVLDPKIETYIGHNQFEALKLLIYSEIAMANVSKEYFTASGLSDEVAEKIMQVFLGYEKPEFGIASKEVPVEVVVQGLNNQLYQFRFDCKIDVYSYKDKQFGINGGITTQMWLVSKPNQKLREIACAKGMINEANMDSFCQGLWKVAESSMKSAYKKVWGSDADKLVNEIIEGSIDSIASKGAKYGLEKPIQMCLKRFYEAKLKDKFSSKLFDLLIYQSKKAVAKCPVDIYVYNSNNVLVGSIISDKATILGNGVALWTVGDDKYVQLFNDTYQLVYKATGTGTMDISIYDQLMNNYDYRNCEFIQVPLSQNIEYSQSVNDELMTNVENYKLTSNDGMEIKATKEQDLFETITIIEKPKPTPTPKPSVTPTTTPMPSETPNPTPTPAEKPTIPELKSVISTYNANTFKWNTVSDADGYRVYRKVNSGKWKAVKTTKETVYKDKDTKAGYKYSYTVKAYKLIDGKKIYSGYDKKGLFGKLNTTVSLKTKNNTVSVSWKKTNGASGYYIYRATSKNGKYSKIKTITSGKTLKYTDKKVKLGKIYYYKVIPFRKISGKSVKSASSEIKSIVLRKIDSKPISSPDSTWENSAVAQKLISYLKKNGMKWQDSSGGTNYTINYLKVGKGSVTLQYQNAHGDQKSMLWMSYSLNWEINLKNREVVTLFWGNQYNSKDSKDSKENEVDIDYRVNSNDNSVVGSILTSSFTEKSKVKFYNNYLKDYTLEQMSEKGNSCLQEALPLFESCLKKGDSGVTMADLGFTKYNFSN